LARHSGVQGPEPVNSLVRKLEEYPFFFATLMTKWPVIDAFLFTFVNHFPDPFYNDYSVGSYNGSQCNFEEAPEAYLRYHLNYMFAYFRYLPVVLSELFFYYNSSDFNFNLRFDTPEFIYLDFWIKSLRVIQDFFAELLIRDAPFLEPISLFGNSLLDEDTIKKADLLLFPPVKEADFKEDFFKKVLMDFFTSQKDFLKIIGLYLNARPEILQMCRD